MSEYASIALPLIDDHTVTFADLCDACAMSAAEVDELMEYGALQAVQPASQVLIFDAEYVAPLREAGKLRRDYDLDLFMVVILMDFLKRIASLEHQLHVSHLTTVTHT
jgi:hypothetical protein